MQAQRALRAIIFLLLFSLVMYEPGISRVRTMTLQVNVDNAVDVTTLRVRGWRYKSHVWISTTYGNARLVLWNGTPRRAIKYKTARITYWRYTK